MKKILAVLLAVMLLVSAFAGCSGEKAEAKDGSAIALKIGEHEFTVEDMNYMYVTSFNDVYSNFYSYYGTNIYSIVDVSKPLEEQMIAEDLTWHQYISDVAVGTTKSIVGVYDKAMEEGYTLPEDYQADIDTLEEQLEELAAGYGMSAEEYIISSYGENVSIEAIKKMTELQFYCNAYVQDYKEGIEVSEEDINAYYEANRKDIDAVDFRYYTSFYGESASEEATLTKEEAEANANRLAETTNAEEFNAVAKEITTDEELKKYFDEGDPTIFSAATYSGIGIDEVSEWLFDEARVAGDTMVYHDENYQSYLTVMYEAFVDPDYDFVNVRHIIIDPETAEDGTISDEAWASAENKANELHKEYLEGEATEEAFAALATEYSSDSSASRGGLIEDVYKGQMVQTFNDWCFDETRAAGDTGIVKSQYGYHIMYFVGFGANNLVSLIEPTIIQERTSAFIADCEVNLTEEATAEMENVGGMIDDIVAAANGLTETETAETEKETKSFTGIIIGVLVAIIIVCIIIIIKNGKGKKAEPEVTEAAEETEESVLEATDEDLTEEELAAEEAFEETEEETSEE